MAVGIDMFGTGGEGLGGLFVGNQLAMQRDAAEMERQKAMQDIANSQSMMRARDQETSFQEQTMPDRVAAIKEEALGKKLKNDAERFARTGEQFGQFSAALANVPALARPAVLKSMAREAGVADDNPLLASLSEVDPEQLPGVLSKIGEGFYQQSTAGRAMKAKAEEARITEREKAEARAADREKDRQLKQMLAEQGFALRRDLMAASQAGQDRRAAQRAGSRSGPGGGALTTDKAIAGLIMNDPDLTPQEKLEALQRYNLSKTTVGKPDTAAEVLGTPKASQRVEEAIRGTSGGGASAPKGNTKFQEGKIYQDASGNKARFENGKWVPIGAPAVPK